MPSLPALLLSCFPSRHPQSRRSQPLLAPSTEAAAARPRAPDKLVALDPTADVQAESCVFCALEQNGIAGPERVRYADDALVVFRDRSQGARQHLLVIPRGHVAESVKDLTALDVPLLLRMRAVGRTALEQDLTTAPASGADASRFKFGFHIPPLTSVPHLHLHAFELPHSSTMSQVEFRRTRRSGGRPGKKIGWFVELDQVIDILEAGKRVTVKGVSL